jgi:hypothetical protein
MRTLLSCFTWPTSRQFVSNHERPDDKPGITDKSRRDLQQLTAALLTLRLRRIARVQANSKFSILHAELLSLRHQLLEAKRVLQGDC